MSDHEAHLSLLEECHRLFGVELLPLPLMRLDGLREGVTAHTFFNAEGVLTGDLRRQIRRWLEGRGWQFSRQFRRPEPGGEPTEYVFLAPEQRVPLAVGYHATRGASLDAILRDGLLPGEDTRTTTDRADCEGNIYVCEA